MPKSQFTKNVQRVEKKIVQIAKRVDAFLVPDYSRGRKISGIIGMPVKMTKEQNRRRK